MSSIIKSIEQKCTRKLFKGGNFISPPNPSQYATYEYVDNPTYSDTSVDFSNMLSIPALGMTTGGGKDLQKIARYISKLFREKNKTIDKNAKYQLASYLYMKISCLITKSKSQKKLLKF